MFDLRLSCVVCTWGLFQRCCFTFSFFDKFRNRLQTYMINALLRHLQRICKTYGQSLNGLNREVCAATTNPFTRFGFFMAIHSFDRMLYYLFSRVLSLSFSHFLAHFVRIRVLTTLPAEHSRLWDVAVSAMLFVLCLLPPPEWWISRNFSLSTFHQPDISYVCQHLTHDCRLTHIILFCVILFGGIFRLFFHRFCWDACGGRWAMGNVPKTECAWEKYTLANMGNETGESFYSILSSDREPRHKFHISGAGNE